MQEVTTTRTIKVGSTYRIHPTEAYLGIDRGIVEVVGLGEIIPPDSDMSNLEKQVSISDGCMELNELGLLEYETSLSLFSEDDEDRQVMKDSLDTEVWVAYKYNHMLCRSSDVTIGEVYQLPISVFQDSITGY